MYGPLAARLEGSQRVASAVRARMLLSRPGAVAMTVLRGFSATQWQALFGAFQPEQVWSAAARAATSVDSKVQWHHRLQAGMCSLQMARTA